MEISFCSHPNVNIVIATIFGTWHDSWAVVRGAKFCSDMITSNWIRAKWNFHQIWIVIEKSLVKWVPGQHCYDNAQCHAILERVITRLFLLCNIFLIWTLSSWSRFLLTILGTVVCAASTMLHHTMRPCIQTPSALWGESIGHRPISLTKGHLCGALGLFVVNANKLLNK